MLVKFIGYVEYEPTHWHGEFILRGHHTLPDGQYDYDTLLAFGIRPPEFPDLYKWRRDRFQRSLRNKVYLAEL